jgi:SlyX protein
LSISIAGAKGTGVRLACRANPHWSNFMVMPADRLTTLEIRAAEQEKTIEELSGQIAEQWKVIDRMQKKLDALTERFLSLEEQVQPDVPVTKPPHW